MDTAAPARRPTWLWVLAGLAMLAWLALVLSELTRPSTRGEYMVGFYLMQMNILAAMWAFVLVAVALAMRGSAAPRGMVVPAMAIMLLSAVTTLLPRPPMVWMGMFGILVLPPLYLAYAFWARLPALQARIGPTAATSGVWGFALLLALACLIAQ